MDIILKYFPDLSSQQQQSFKQLYDFYNYWCHKVNLISKQDLEHIYLRHMLHSLSIAKFIQFTPNTRIIDLGTGGGLPGLPLAILFPEVQFTLLDATKKKIELVSKAIEILGLVNVRCHNKRVELEYEQYDFIVTRAMAKMSQLVKWSKTLLLNNYANPKKNGLIALKGGDLSQELQRLPTAITIPVNSFFEEPFFETKQIVYVPFTGL